ncbi:uroporphyrinogen-III synthase [Haladaptatus paucihalophilus DX253]|uniref:Uroporphyrinogen-III synthase n=1 Tax=Haladaptatus paucihalophilus DX253 TaxID=797209 RepID=E7QXV2_HALPU|nr:uroporphyrinogen-III synthase [Haladaptatus paucihalophilus]EFW90653.1 uroporphyrinogen-III synthase [Haladaptatus paucihalophilus DX253]SHL56286.1 uroporphyrinogen-III synthase [Haladaptatus paucihalophilus DX253]
MKVAVFRPDDERLDEAVDLLESLGADPVPDPMLAVRPTDNAPQHAEYVVLTSKTGVELAHEAGWSPDGATVCAIGERTAATLREYGYDVDIVPDEFSSRGLVATLADRVDGKSVEVARSDHGSEVLTDGLADAGADVHETVLYELVRPGGSGRSAELAADGDLDAALFTSSLTVYHFLDAAEERGIRAEAVDGLEDATVGAIGDPTHDTASELDIRVDVVPETASFDRLAREAVERITDGGDEAEV